MADDQFPWTSAWIPILIGLGLEPFALVLAIISTGAGHGDYLLARVLFPYTMLGTLAFDDRIAPPLVLLALVQFPLYGLIVGLVPWGVARWLVLAVIVVAHVWAATLTVSGLLPAFS